MTAHVHELAPQGPLPDPICPGIEVLVHRRATELIAERPRRRVATWSSVGGVAVAAACAVLVLVLGAPSGGGLLSPRQAVAAAVASLDGNGILHWVRRGDAVVAPASADRPGTRVEEQWTDLATGDSHLVTTTTPADGAVQTRATWKTADADWIAVGSGASGASTIHREPRAEGQEAPLTAVDEVRALLERAERGQAEIADGGEHEGKPLVVVTERFDGALRRVWITRDEDPSVVRSEATVTSPNTARPIVTTTETTTWQILPRTPEALADVAVPTNANRVP